MAKTLVLMMIMSIQNQSGFLSGKLPADFDITQPYVMKQFVMTAI